MLDISEPALRDLVPDAVEFRRKHTRASANRIKRYVSKNYREDWEPDGENHENFPWEFVVNTHPALMASNPATSIDSAFRSLYPRLFTAFDFGMNGWIKQQKYAKKANRVALDVFFDFGVRMIGIEPMPGYEDDPENEQPPPLRPFMDRISPRRFFCDPMADCFEHCRFMGHIWVRDQEDLLKVGYDDKAVMACATDVDMGEEINPSPDDGRVGRTRNRVIGYEMYIPELRQIICVGMSGNDGSDAIMLGPPKDYFGPRRGPYVMSGCYWAPDQIYPVPPLAVTEDLEEEINAHAGQISEDAGAAKTVGMVNGDKKTLDTIVYAKNGTWAASPNFTKDNVQIVTIPGPQPANLEHLALLRERLDRKGGLTQTKRGQTPADVTATATREAAQGSDARTQMMQSNFREGEIECLDSVLWFMNESDQVRFPVEVEDPQTRQKTTVEFIGGNQEALGVDPMTGQPLFPHTPTESLSVSIEPFSMEWVNDAVRQRRMQAAGEITMTAIQFSMQMPAFKVEEFLDDQMEALNIKGGGSRYVDYALLRQIQMQQMMMAQAQQQAAMQQGAGGPAGPGQPAQPGSGGPQPNTPAGLTQPDESQILAEMARAA